MLKNNSKNNILQSSIPKSLQVPQKLKHPKQLHYNQKNHLTYIVALKENILFYTNNLRLFHNTHIT